MSRLRWTTAGESHGQALIGIVEGVPAGLALDLERVNRELERELSGAALSDRRQAFLDTLKKGSFVYLPRYRQRVPVHKVDRAKRELTVKLGTMNLKVSFDEVTSYEAL